MLCVISLLFCLIEFLVVFHIEFLIVFHIEFLFVFQVKLVIFFDNLSRVHSESIQDIIHRFGYMKLTATCLEAIQ